MQNKPVVPVHKAEQAMTALKEANQRQKEALDRMLDERNEMLDLFESIWDELSSVDAANKIEKLLRENGRFS